MLTTLCLALVVYTEARGETLEGQFRVAEVVINRVGSDTYPSDLCDVAYQPKQFSGMEEGFDLLEISADPAWDTAVDVAYLSLAGDLPDTGSTHFHATSVTPYWSKKLTKVDSLGGHTFYKE
jgi:spore germination cell wall hydrolase CwlJ-like protein